MFKSNSSCDKEKTKQKKDDNLFVSPVWIGTLRVICVEISQFYFLPLPPTRTPPLSTPPPPPLPWEQEYKSPEFPPLFPPPPPPPPLPWEQEYKSPEYLRKTPDSQRVTPQKDTTLNQCLLCFIQPLVQNHSMGSLSVFLVALIAMFSVGQCRPASDQSSEGTEIDRDLQRQFLAEIIEKLLQYSSGNNRVGLMVPGHRDRLPIKRNAELINSILGIPKIMSDAGRRR
ncbi:unnamed protein product [Cyprideis torosa]|uniref:Uncharacterized protein n=1 Tax=Cyprideis torosa TaxID=163714 RepID=A0A7R8W8V8_9CRUS|nr:unnamed protein product [Cyprideis torosa]CAG0884713.1 unnamed protein product [Cyprideis torosa]